MLRLRNERTAKSRRKLRRRGATCDDACDSQARQRRKKRRIGKVRHEESTRMAMTCLVTASASNVRCSKLEQNRAGKNREGDGARLPIVSNNGVFLKQNYTARRGDSQACEVLARKRGLTEPQRGGGAGKSKPGEAALGPCTHPLKQLIG